MRWIAEHREQAQLMGDAGQRFVTEEYNWEKESLKLVDLYARLSA